MHSLDWTPLSRPPRGLPAQEVRVTSYERNGKYRIVILCQDTAKILPRDISALLHDPKIVESSLYFRYFADNPVHVIQDGE